MHARRIAIVVAALAVLGVFLWLFGEPLIEKQKFYRFDRSLWLASKPEQRYYMATYIVDHRVVVGKTSLEVVAMLGESDKSGAMMLYCLGPERGSMLRVDDDWLELTLEQIGGRLQVAQSRIRPD